MLFLNKFKKYERKPKRNVYTNSFTKKNNVFVEAYFLTRVLNSIRFAGKPFDMEICVAEAFCMIVGINLAGAVRFAVVYSIYN